jgi:hypothetical protein
MREKLPSLLGEDGEGRREGGREGGRGEGGKEGGKEGRRKGGRGEGGEGGCLLMEIEMPFTCVLRNYLYSNTTWSCPKRLYHTFQQTTTIHSKTRHGCLMQV